MPANSRERLSGIIESLKKPLTFAARDDFARLDTVKGIGPLADTLCREALSLGLPPEAGESFTELKGTFSGFDSLAPDTKKERIQKALALIETLRIKPGGVTPGGVTPSGVTAPAKDTPPYPELSPAETAGRLKTLNSPVEALKGVGAKFAKRLNKKGFSSVEDLLYFLPIRYEDRSRIKKIAALQPGANEVATGEVMAAGEARYGRRKLFEAVLSDGTGLLKLKWFNYRLPYMRERYYPGRRLMVYGQVSAFGAQKEIIHPDVEFVEKGEGGEAGEEDAKEFEGVVPVYSQIDNMHQKTIRKLMGGAVETYAGSAVGGVPREVAERHRLMSLPEAFTELHAPKGPPELRDTARKSLAFDEFFLLELGLALKRKTIKKEGGVAFKGDYGLEKKLRELLPFSLTNAQERVIEEVRRDMAAPHPMNRLIQGDVGSGKTVVSYMAVLNAVENGWQAAIMAPTEILAEQHFLTTRAFSESLGVRTACLTGNTPAALKRKTLSAVKEGEVDLLIGTHALIQKDVCFKRLGLAVVDEQHRFGVVQRAAIKKKAGEGEGGEEKLSPDILVMTATPIPRTLSMTVYGELDVSIIDELPAGRKPVTTKLLRERDREKAYGVVRDEVAKGGQAYIVYPLVEESEELSLKDATNMKDHLAKDI
ncbi:MAG: ATP-dependent DNA helicase RecG, partial [Thermodesulfobacteriota bacterium]